MLSRWLKYSSLDMSAVRMLLVIMSKPISSYLGMMTGRVTPARAITIWLAVFLVSTKPAEVNTLTSVFQLVGNSLFDIYSKGNAYVDVLIIRGFVRLCLVEATILHYLIEGATFVA